MKTSLGGSAEVQVHQTMSQKITEEKRYKVVCKAIGANDVYMVKDNQGIVYSPEYGTLNHAKLHLILMDHLELLGDYGLPSTEDGHLITYRVSVRVCTIEKDGTFHAFDIYGPAREDEE